MEEISLEDLALGILPKKSKKGTKPEPVSTTVAANVKKMAAMALKQESMSIKALKKNNKTELKMLLKAADKLQDALYRAKEMIREAAKIHGEGDRMNSAVGGCY